MTDNIYLWYDRHGVLIARGTSEEGAIENLKKHYSEEALAHTYSIIDPEQQPGAHRPPDRIMWGTEERFQVPLEATIINIELDVREWAPW